MTKQMSHEDLMEARDRARGRTDTRFLVRQEKREREAESLIGELCREGATIYYINTRSKSGDLTGTRQFASHGQAVSFLLRNNYV